MLLYIHIPFCDSKCFYCAFNSYTDKFYLKTEYMIALKKQLKSEIEKNLKNRKLKTVFIGGGTPSTINAKEYEEVFEIIKPHLCKNAEITTEANPNSASYKWQEKMYSYGVNRISFGVQSFNQDKLKFLGRAHSSNSALKAIQNANCIGFNSINCDIIYGVKGDSLDLIKQDINTAFTLNVTHISAYSLMIEEGTKFYKKDKQTKISNYKIDDEELSKDIFDYLQKKDFNQYEISNFARKKEFESKHNYGYWQHQEYLGIGAGAVGYYKNKRVYTKKDIQAYIKNPFLYETEELSNEDIKVEKTLLGLRCNNGVSIDIFNSNEKSKIDELISEKKIYRLKNRVYNRDFLLSDELALYILG
ncbi:MAG: radical SAM family heme chaperone HemW [Campylobacterota bacterium]